MKQKRSQGDWSSIRERMEAREVMCMRDKDFHCLFIWGFKWNFGTPRNSQGTLNELSNCHRRDAWEGQKSGSWVSSERVSVVIPALDTPG